RDEVIPSAQGTGNNVGKTTTLRAIDYCFGANQNIFYKDSEFKKDNSEVVEFFNANTIKFELLVENKYGRNIIIERSIDNEFGRGIFTIDGEEFTSLKSYCNGLKNVIFLSASEKPTLRQIIPRFIRNTPDKMSNTLRVLYSTTSDADYESINLFLLGFEDPKLLASKSTKTKQISKHNKILASLKSLSSKSALEQGLSIIDRDILEKEDEIRSFKLNDSYAQELEEIATIKNSIAEISLRLSSSESKIKIQRRSIDNFKNNVDDTNPAEIRAIYDEAKTIVPDMRKSSEEALNFHNQMIVKKIDFMVKNISSLEESCIQDRSELNRLLEIQSKKLDIISSTGTLDDLYLLNSQLNNLYEKKGEIVKSLSQLGEEEGAVEVLNNELKTVNEKIENHM